MVDRQWWTMLSNIEALMNDIDAYTGGQVPYEATAQWYLRVRQRYEISIMQLGLHKVSDKVTINVPRNWIALQNNAEDWRADEDIDGMFDQRDASSNSEQHIFPPLSISPPSSISSTSTSSLSSRTDTNNGKEDDNNKACSERCNEASQTRFTDQRNRPNPRPNPQPSLNFQHVGYHNTLSEGKEFLVIKTLLYGTISVTPTGKTKYGTAGTKLKFMLRSPPISQYGLDIYTTTNDSVSPGRHWALDMTLTEDYIGSKKGSGGGYKGPDFANVVTIMNTVIQFLIDMKHYSGIRLYDREYVMYSCENLRTDYSTRAVKSLLVNDVLKRFNCSVDNKEPFEDVMYLQLIAEEPELVQNI